MQKPQEGRQKGIALEKKRKNEIKSNQKEKKRNKKQNVSSVEIEWKKCASAKTNCYDVDLFRSHTHIRIRSTEIQKNRYSSKQQFPSFLPHNAVDICILYVNSISGWHINRMLTYYCYYMHRGLVVKMENEKE